MTTRTEVQNLQKTLGHLISRQDRNSDENGAVVNHEVERVLVASIARYEADLATIQASWAANLQAGAKKIDILASLDKR